MTVPESAWVFDTGPLRHFAAQGWLGVLRFLAGERRIYIPDTVERELHEAADHLPAVRQALDVDWIHVHRLTSLEDVEKFSRYHDRLVADGRNTGECGVLAMGKVYGCELVIDDATPRRIAEEEGIKVTATVPILCDAIRAQKLTTVMVEELADNLLEGAYYLPFGPGGFRQHVLENGLLEYDEL
ncbi:nucleotide-binding protein [Streptomyces sp. WAC 05379]|uniref:nucleotide-binding protein n=1 Tax=Streptomyces TaxID=1883 RepID=UPI000F74A6A7|nr:nucleotide-binding protein [Streptomyces sp. WAC 05379]RSN91157.1 nucleotide-binding protein [Streptomyces sp. WAC 05379]